MYSVFPTFAFLRSTANLSVRQAAQRIGVSHTYLSQLEDFMFIPLPETTNKFGRLLIAEVKEFILDYSPMMAEHFQMLNLEADYSFYSLRHPWWHTLITRPDGYGRGPLLTVLLRCYFFGYTKKNEGIMFFFPNIDERELYLNDIINNFCQRYYTPESFRRRKPKGWTSIPPFYNNREEYGIYFKSDSIDERQVFYSHPTSYYFALFLIYSLLREVTISTDGIDCCIDNNNDTVFETHFPIYKNHFNYAEFYKHRETQTQPKIHATFKLTAPIFRAPTYLEAMNQYESKNQFIELPKNTAIRLCVSDPFFPSKWCYCLSSV